MPKLIGHSPSANNRPASKAPKGTKLVKISYSQKKLLPQSLVYFVYDTSDKGCRGALAKLVSLVCSSRKPRQLSTLNAKYARRRSPLV